MKIIVKKSLSAIGFSVRENNDECDRAAMSAFWQNDAEQLYFYTITVYEPNNKEVDEAIKIFMSAFNFLTCIEGIENLISGFGCFFEAGGYKVEIKEDAEK